MNRLSLFFSFLFVGALSACVGEVAGEGTHADLAASERKERDEGELAQQPDDESDESAVSHDDKQRDAGTSEKPRDTKPTEHGKAERPSYNKGVGFFVKDGKLYDAKGSEFRVRGVNKLHWDMASPGLAKANVPATRWTVDFKLDQAKNLALLTGDDGHGGTIAEDSVIIPGNWEGTCKDDPALLRSIVDTWIDQAPMWQSLEEHMILNIANEWGPGNGEVWRDAYVEAIHRLREAGFHATISVTAGGCGQDPKAIVEYGQEVFDADPEKNVIFDQHIYGEYTDVEGGAMGKFDDMPDLGKHVKDLADTGLVVMLGEFGPGRDIGPSPTMIDPLRVIELAEGAGLGWLAWAWDDNNLEQGMSDDKGFGMSIRGHYDTSDDLTQFGRRVVEHPDWGLKKLGKKASIFDR